MGFARSTNIRVESGTLTPDKKIIQVVYLCNFDTPDKNKLCKQYTCVILTPDSKKLCTKDDK